MRPHLSQDPTTSQECHPRDQAFNHGPVVDIPDSSLVTLSGSHGTFLISPACEAPARVWPC